MARDSYHELPLAQVPKGGIQHYCRDCANAYDRHSNDIEGNPILCRCPHYKGGRFSVFLKDKACVHFKLK